MSEMNLTRRGLIGAASMLAVSAAGQRASASPSSTGSVLDSPLFTDYDTYAAGFDKSLDSAFEFLDAMMDAYAAGSTVRLVQSYSDQGGLLSTAFTYDNAVLLHAYLARGKNDDYTRAEILGDSLLYAQAHNFPFNDGRFGQGYFVNSADGNGAFVQPAANPFYFYTSSVGDQAWAGLALAQLFNVTGKQKYLTGAIKVANWIVSNHYSTLGPGGFSWGTTINPSNQSVPSTNGKSTEHNIDCYAFFNMLAKLSGTRASNGMTWSSLANHALTFLNAMFNAKAGFFYVGTNADQITVSPDIIPEDCQTWSYLALLCPIRGVSVDWVFTHLRTIDSPSNPQTAMTALGNVAIEGETFDTASLWTNSANYDPHAVWLEGTAHTAAAMIARKKPAQHDNPFDRGDIYNAFWLLENCKLAQLNLGTDQTVSGAALAQGGLVSSTGKLDTGFGYGYFANLHIGATGWYALALRGANPYQLGYNIP